MADIATEDLPLTATMAVTDELIINADVATVPVTKRIALTNAVPFTTTPTANGIPRANGSGKIDQNWITDYKNLWLVGWKPTVTNGCDNVTQIEMATNKNVYDVLPFEAGATKKAYIYVPMPLDYDGGAITFQAYWAHPTGGSAFDVLIGMTGVAIDNAETMDVATGSNAYIADTGGTANTLYISPESSALTIAGTPTAGKLVYFVLFRYGDYPSSPDLDTLDIDAYLVGILVKYGVQ